MRVLLSFSSSRWSEVGWPRFVEGAVSEHGEQDVGSASGQSDDGLVVAFAFGSFLVVVRAGSGIAFDRSESGEEQHTLEDFVATSGRGFSTDGGPGVAGYGCDAGI